MKVLQINAVYKKGSTGRNIYEMKRIMENQGIEMIVAATNIDGDDCEFFKIGNSRDWKFHALLSRMTGLQGYFSKRPTLRLIDYIDRVEPDIVHLNNLHSNYLMLPILFQYLKQKKIPTVISLHDCWAYTGKCTHYSMDNCFKWMYGCEFCPKLRADNNSWFFDRTFRMWSDKRVWYKGLDKLAVVGVSDWITNEAKKSILSDADIIKRIYNGVDLEIFRPTNGTKKDMKFFVENKSVLLGVANFWSDKKGLKQFIELANAIPSDYVIVLIGHMPNVVLPSSIIHIDATDSPEELADYYSAADIFIQLSMEESFGKVVAEALACGTPVVTVDSTANKELVTSECGIVVGNLSVETILNAIHEIKLKGKAYYCDCCREFAEKNFNMEEKTREYINLYYELLEL